MGKVLAFPGVTLKNYDEGHPFLPHEVAFAVISYVAFMTIQPSLTGAKFAFGVSEEGDGWIAAYAIDKQVSHRKDHLDSTNYDMGPIKSFEKRSDGVHAEFNLNIPGKLCRIVAPSLSEAYYKRMPELHAAFQLLFYHHHAKKYNEIAFEIQEYPDRIVDTQLSDFSIQSLDYDFINKTHNNVRENLQTQLLHMENAGG